MTEPEQMLTTEEVARRLAVRERTVRSWLRAGQLRGVRLGSRRAGWRIRPTDLDAYLAERTNVRESEVTER